MKEERPRGKANNAENTVESLSEHALNFAADEAGSSEIQVGEGQHVALDAALLLLVDGHNQEHGDKGGGNRGDGPGRLADDLSREVQNLEGNKDEAPGNEGNTQEPIGESFMMLAFAPKEEADVNVNDRSR